MGTIYAPADIFVALKLKSGISKHSDKVDTLAALIIVIAPSGMYYRSVQTLVESQISVQVCFRIHIL